MGFTMLNDFKLFGASKLLKLPKFFLLFGRLVEEVKQVDEKINIHREYLYSS